MSPRCARGTPVIPAGNQHWTLQPRGLKHLASTCQPLKLNSVVLSVEFSFCFLSVWLQGHKRHTATSCYTRRCLPTKLRSLIIWLRPTTKIDIGLLSLSVNYWRIIASAKKELFLLLLVSLDYSKCWIHNLFSNFQNYEITQKSFFDILRQIRILDPGSGIFFQFSKIVIWD